MSRFVACMSMVVLVALAAPALAQSEAKSFTGTSPDGKAVSLDDFKGSVVLIDFWATWCGPCVHEIPNVRKIHKKYHDKGLEIISISVDRDKRALDAFLEGNDMPWHHIHDNGGPIASSYGVRGIPHMAVVGHDGELLGTFVGSGQPIEMAVKRAIERAGDDIVKPADRNGKDKQDDAKADKGEDDKADAKKSSEEKSAERMKAKAEQNLRVARTFLRNGNEKLAKKYFERAVEYDPDGEIGKEAQKELDKLGA